MLVIPARQGLATFSSVAVVRYSLTMSDAANAVSDLMTEKAVCLRKRQTVLIVVLGLMS